MERVALTPEQTRATVHGDASDPAHTRLAESYLTGVLFRQILQPSSRQLKARTGGQPNGSWGGPNVHPVRSR